MRVIVPIAVTDATLSSSSVAENDYPAWASSTTYALGARVIKVATHRIYENVVASNVGNDPAAGDTGKWIDIGPTNRWAMFDQAVGSQSSGTGLITVVLAPTDIVGALAVIDTDAETVRVKITQAGTLVYDQTKTTNVGGAVIEDWLNYFTAELGKVGSLTFLDLPRASGMQIEVTITGRGPSLSVGVGTLLIGNALELGATEIGANVGIQDFSRKDTDDYGVTTVVERAWRKTMTARSLIDATAVDSVQRKLAAIRARAVLWIAEEGFDSLTIYGFFKDFSIDLALPTQSYVSFTIEGLI